MNKSLALRKSLLLCLAVIVLTLATSAKAQNRPDNFRILENCGGSVKLDWSAVNGASNYRISYSRSGPERPAGSTEETTFTLPGLARGATYTVFVDSDIGTWGTITFGTSRSRCRVSAKRPPLVVKTCAEVADRLVVSGIGDGTNCQWVAAAGVGIPSLIATGVIDAVDIWGRDSEVRVCFRNQGTLKFLDAATSPRTVMDLAAEQVDGMTCATIDRSGTVVLVRGSGAASEVGDSPASSTSAEPASVRKCQLTTTDLLSLRAGPNIYYARLDEIPYGARLVANLRAGEWFKVEYEERLGWVSGTYVTKSADCEEIEQPSEVYPQPLTTPEKPLETAETGQAESMAPGTRPLIACRLTAGDIINLRQGPGLEYDIRAEIPNQTRLIATARTREWFHVSFGGAMGWVNIDYVFRNGACG